MNARRTILCLAVLAAILVTAAATAAEPAKSNKTPPQKLEVTIEGIGVAIFAGISGLSMEVEVVEYRDGGDTGTVRKLPGRLKFPDIVLKRGMTSDNALWDWMQKSATGVHDPRKVTFVLFSPDGTPVRTVVIRNAFPVKWEGPSLDASGSDVAIETLVIAHEGFLEPE
jgi:phage tail-like protein